MNAPYQSGFANEFATEALPGALRRVLGRRQGAGPRFGGELVAETGLRAGGRMGDVHAGSLVGGIGTM